MKLQASLAVLLPLFFSAVCYGQIGLVISAPPAQLNSAAEPGWYPFVIARGEDRIKIQNTPMHERPYRPMHFYGNTVRRVAYRGTGVPGRRDLARITTSLIRRR